jgi:ATP-dependent Clp protease ATP-binding subunit ClpA
MHGCSWADIGAVLGLTRQAVQQRFHAPHKRYDAQMLTADLHQAMAHMKQAAVHHRNNYIGTEHLLWGLTAADNTATIMLGAAGASPPDVHAQIGRGAAATVLKGVGLDLLENASVPPA